MKYYKIAWVLLLTALLSSCREENPSVFNPQDEDVFTSWDDVFESFWNGMNYSYAFWDVDPTDWDEVYREYKPRFKDLVFKNSQDSATVKALFTEMTENLVDHHYILTLLLPPDEKEEKGWASIQPRLQEIGKRAYYHKRYFETDIVKTIEANGKKGRINMKDLKYAFVYDEKGEFAMGIYSYCIDNGIVYLRLSAFSITDNLENTKVQETYQNFFNLIETVPDLKGIVIDTRSNGGGSIDDLFFILSPLISKEITFGYTRSKNGMGRLDYTPWSPMTLYPANRSANEYASYITELQIKRNIENIPIVALADLYSGSMAEITPMAICALPNGCLIGERTWGGHGSLNDNFNDSYAGTFENDAFRVQTSTSETKNMDGTIYEGIGLTPDIEALYNETEFLNGNDMQLERAIQYINTGK